MLMQNGNKISSIKTSGLTMGLMVGGVTLNFEIDIEIITVNIHKI